MGVKTDTQPSLNVRNLKKFTLYLYTYVTSTEMCWLDLLLIPSKSENLLLRVKFFSFVRVITLTILIFVTFQGKIRLVRSRELKSEGLSANL